MNDLQQKIEALCEKWIQEETVLRRGSSTAWIKAVRLNKCRHELMEVAGLVVKPEEL